MTHLIFSSVFFPPQASYALSVGLHVRIEVLQYNTIHGLLLDYSSLFKLNHYASNQAYLLATADPIPCFTRFVFSHATVSAPGVNPAPASLLL